MRNRWSLQRAEAGSSHTVENYSTAGSGVELKTAMAVGTAGTGDNRESVTC